MALNFKTMILYYSPAVFCYYLARCIKVCPLILVVALLRFAAPSHIRPPPPVCCVQPPGQAMRSSLPRVLLRVAVLGVAVIGTFAALWWPFCVFAAPGVTCSEGLMHGT